MTTIRHTGHSGEETLELAYPDAFVLGLCETALENLRTYLEANCLDTYGLPVRHVLSGGV